MKLRRRVLALVRRRLAARCQASSVGPAVSAAAGKSRWNLPCSECSDQEVEQEVVKSSYPEASFADASHAPAKGQGGCGRRWKNRPAEVIGTTVSRRSMLKGHPQPLAYRTAAKAGGLNSRSRKK